MSRQRWKVRFTARSAEDLVRLVEFVAARDPAGARAVRDALADAVEVLRRLPLTARPARLAGRATLRELVVPLGRAGYVLLLEVEQRTVTVLRIRHQLESEET